MTIIEHSLDIPAPVSRVWALTVDVERWPAITPDTITSVERADAGPFGVGSQARIKQPAQPSRVWTVTDLAAERSFAWSTSARGYAMKARHVLEPIDDSSTRNSLTIELTGPLAGLVKFLGGRQIRKTIAKENECFSRAATAP